MIILLENAHSHVNIVTEALPTVLIAKNINMYIHLTNHIHAVSMVVIKPILIPHVSQFILEKKIQYELNLNLTLSSFEKAHENARGIFGFQQ